MLENEKVRNLRYKSSLSESNQTSKAKDSVNR